MNDRFKIVLLVLALTFLGCLVVALALTAPSVINSFSREIENALTNNTAQNLCESKGGTYHFTDFGGEHYCYIDDIKYNVYMRNNVWRLSK